MVVSEKKILSLAYTILFKKIGGLAEFRKPGFHQTFHLKKYKLWTRSVVKGLNKYNLNK